MKTEQTNCSKTSAYKIQMPGNYPEQNTEHTEHGENLKSRICHLYGEKTARHKKQTIIYRSLESTILLPV
jgi:hypothetical protein